MASTGRESCAAAQRRCSLRGAPCSRVSTLAIPSPPRLPVQEVLPDPSWSTSELRETGGGQSDLPRDGRGHRSCVRKVSCLLGSIRTGSDRIGPEGAPGEHACRRSSGQQGASDRSPGRSTLVGLRCAALSLAWGDRPAQPVPSCVAGGGRRRTAAASPRMTGASTRDHTRRARHAA